VSRVKRECRRYPQVCPGMELLSEPFGSKAGLFQVRVPAQGSKQNLMAGSVSAD
jgi:hypothetical protein